jgi:hypothetical protein
MNARPMKAGAGLVLLLTTAAGGVRGQDTPAARARVEFRVVVTHWATETVPGGSGMTGPLAEGESTEMNMQMRLVPAAGEVPCSTSTTFGPYSVESVGPLPLWHVEATVRRVRMDDIAVSYAWTRKVQTPAGTKAAEGRGKATLTEAGRVLLDYVPVSDVAAGCVRNVALELAASIPEDPVFAERRIAYDLWLVREDGPDRATRRLQLIGKQGQNVEFDYGLFRAQLRDVPLPARPIPGSDVMEMTVSGSVRSRLQPDGSIELLLAAFRSARPSDGRWATTAHGEKRVRATPGETLRLELPPPAPMDDVKEPETFAAIAKQSVALILTPTLVE